MCKSLKINYTILAKRNLKKLLVDKFHRFLNKAITIAAENRVTNDVFFAAGVAAGCALNSLPFKGLSSFVVFLPLVVNLGFP